MSPIIPIISKLVCTTRNKQFVDHIQIVGIISSHNMSALKLFSNHFWSSSIWLPPNTTWADLDKHHDLAQWHHLIYPLPMAVGLIIFRQLLDQMIFRPLGRALNIKDTYKKKPEAHPVLESAFIKGSRDYSKLVIASGMTERQVHSWMRRRTQASR